MIRAGGPPARGGQGGIVLPLLLGGIVIAILLALGTWQVRRLAWKQDLIIRTERNLHAPPVPPPPPRAWGTVGLPDAYRRVTMVGTFDQGAQVRVQALTVRGAGFWVMTPLNLPGGWAILVNRGFVPADRTVSTALPAGPATVTGLLRLSEPGGGFLRSNDPAHDRWYSRDVVAIGRAHGLTRIAPYFVDADATPNPGGYPVGGLTVVAFANNHLVYAITWYALALMLAGALAALVIARRRAGRG